MKNLILMVVGILLLTFGTWMFIEEPLGRLWSCSVTLVTLVFISNVVSILLFDNFGWYDEDDDL